jgi:hypothetical protein
MFASDAIFFSCVDAIIQSGLIWCEKIMQTIVNSLHHERPNWTVSSVEEVLKDHHFRKTQKQVKRNILYEN